MRSQKELEAYYRKEDFNWHGFPEINIPKDYRIVDPKAEEILSEDKTFHIEEPQWSRNCYRNPDWVWITKRPLPDFAPERQMQTVQADQTSKAEKQTSKADPTSQTQTSMNKSKTYIVNYGPVNYEVPETALRALFQKDSLNRPHCLQSPFHIVNEFLTHGNLSSEDAEIKVVHNGNVYHYLITPDGNKFFYFPPAYTRTVKFVYRKNRDEVNWRTLGVTEETETYLCGIDLADNQFKKFLREKVLGGEVIEVTDQQG
jgi:hypothetical protein